MKLLATVSAENPKKFEFIGSDKTVHLSTRFSMLIPNTGKKRKKSDA
jgi:hypothetical protein